MRTRRLRVGPPFHLERPALSGKLLRDRIRIDINLQVAWPFHALSGASVVPGGAREPFSDNVPSNLAAS
jgi:hypothetical protein